MNLPPGRSRFFLPLAYLVVGVIWVVGSDFALGEASNLPLAMQLIATAKGIAFVLASALLLLLVQAWPRSAPLPKRLPAKLGGSSVRPFLVFLITASGVVLAGVVLYQQQAREAARRATDLLASTTDLTARQLEFWIEERRNGLESASRNPLLAHALRGRADSASEHLQGGLDVLRESEGFARVQVYAPTGEPIANAGGPIALSDRLQFWMRGAQVTGRMVISDLYLPADSADGRPAIDFVVAIADEHESNKVGGVLVARADPVHHLLPILAASAGTSQEVTFSLARRQDNGVAVLLPSALRGDQRGAVDFEMVPPQAAANLVAKGVKEVFETQDARGIAMLASGRAVANTPWFLVAEMDKATVLAPLQRLGRPAILLAIAGLAMSALVVGLWWRSERLDMALQLEAAELRTAVLKEHFAIAGRYVHDIVLLLDDGDATIIDANDRALDAYGYTRDELLARSLFDLRPKGSPDELAAHERFEALRAFGGGSFVTRHWRKDGSSFPVEVSARYFVLDGRPFVQMVGRDITERVDQEERLAALSAERDLLLERMQRQFDHMAAACIILSPAGEVLQTNPAHARMFGHPQEDIVGLNVRDIISSATFLEDVLHWIENLRRDPETQFTGVYQNATAEGRSITCRWTATALRDPNGECCGLIGMAEDITDQVVAERALRDSEQRYRTITEISPVGIFRTDPQGRTVFVNRRCSDILGMPAADCLGLGWVLALHPDDASGYARVWQDYLGSGGTRSHESEARALRPDGSIVWVLTQVAPEFDLSGHLQGHIGTLTDITALKVAEIELRQVRDHLEERVVERTREFEQAKDKAEHSDRVKTAFLSTMSHELRTPLNSILGFTDVLLQGLSGPLNDAQQKQLQIVRDSSSHLRSLIEDVLDISRIEAGQVGLEFTDVDLRELVARRVEAFGPEAVRKGIELRVDAPAALPLIRSDRARAGQIVNNLLSNALKFTDEGSVTVAMRATSERLEIAVTDTGIGIPAEAAPRLFNPFTQVVRPGGRLHEGTGLGLAISRTLARALGGDITLAAASGRGSCFTFWLPLVVGEVDQASVSALHRRPDFRRAVDAV